VHHHDRPASHLRQVPVKEAIIRLTLTPVPVRVAVVDPLPMYRQGVIAVLGAAGYAVESPADLPGWLRRAGRAVILLTIGSAGTLELLGRLQEVPGGHSWIAVVEEGLGQQGVRALHAGARAVLWRTASPTAVLRAVEAAAEGQSVLPAELVGLLTGGPAVGVTGLDPLTADEIAWLQQLADGATVAEVAARSGYSERAMFRLLRRVYGRLGVATRTQAVVRAQTLGWLTEADPQAGNSGQA
jgi:DNA-binding NarL/FixJ family response regulator